MTTEIRLLTLCAALAAGEACGFAADAAAPLWPLAAGLVLLAALFGYALRVRGWPVLAVFGLGVVLAWRAGGARQDLLEDVQVMHGGRPYTAEFRVEGRVLVRKDKSGQAWASFASALGPLAVRVIFPCPDGRVPQEGEQWVCSGWLARKAEGPGGRLPFWSCGRGSFARPAADGAAGPSVWRRRVRENLAARLGIGLAGAPRVADLHRAILLGERTRIDPALKANFIAAGTIHVFAISGLHVMVVARVLGFLLAWTRLGARGAALALIPLIWGYAYLTGLAPSALRATVLVMLANLAPCVWRRPNGLVAWALTFLGVYALAPARLHDVGCGLSFAVMLALALWSRWGVKARARAVDLVAFTAVAWAASLPIAAHVFGRITPGGLLANLALAPLAAGSVTGSLIGVLLSFVSADLAAVANNLTAVCTELMVGLSEGVAALPGSNFQVAPWPLGACFAWYALLALALAALHRWDSRRRHMV